MLLEVDQLTAGYGPVTILHQISLGLSDREIVCIIGPNGAGKSTVLRAVSGQITPEGGRVIFDGKDMTRDGLCEKAEKGLIFIPQGQNIFPNLTVLDNLMMGVKGGKVDTSNPNAWTIKKIFEHFPFMSDRTMQKGVLLSGGEQQMLTIGRTLMGNPKLLMVDEPTEGLSPVMVKEVRDVLAEIGKSGISILLVEHNLKVAMSLADRIYLMGKAHLGFTGTIAELDANPEMRAKYLEV